MTSPNPTLSTKNISLNNSPFIWGNIALIAGVPWLLALSMAGLAVGDPVFPAWFEILLLGLPAIALTTWVQWQQPISPFSLWFVAKPNENLSDRDRQMLTLIKQHRNGWYTTGWIAAAVAILMSVIFCKIYLSAPLAQAIAPFPAGLRLFGILWAEIFFVLSNVLMQAGISALRIKLTAESELISLQPFTVTKIKNNFTTIGWRSPQLLKFFEEEPETNNLVEGSEVIEALEPKAPISEPEQIIEELQIEPILDKEVVQIEELDPIVEELAIAADASLIETVLEPIEISPDKGIIQESEELNPFELIKETELAAILDAVSLIAELEIAETEIESILELAIEEILVATTLESPETDEEILEKAEELEVNDFVAEKQENKSQDFDDELDELIAFNVYVENILQEYLENKDENSIELETQVSEDITEDVFSNDQATKDSKYLVQELLVDKFLARLEELNITDRANKANVKQTTESSSEPNSEVDEFADLEALLDGNPLPQNLE
jgi:hypothetical protein